MYITMHTTVAILALWLPVNDIFGSGTHLYLRCNENYTIMLCMEEADNHVINRPIVFATRQFDREWLG